MSVLRIKIYVICLTEIWLSDLCYDHNVIPDCYTVFLSERVSIDKTRGDGTLLCPLRVPYCKRSLYFDSCDKYMWVEIPTFDGLNLLIGNYYLVADAKPEVITNYFLVYKTSWIQTIVVLLWLGILTFQVSTGNVICLC
jgi:hypothetical protein